MSCYVFPYAAICSCCVVLSMGWGIHGNVPLSGTWHERKAAGEVAKRRDLEHLKLAAAVGRKHEKMGVGWPVANSRISEVGGADVLPKARGLVRPLRAAWQGLSQAARGCRPGSGPVCRCPPFPVLLRPLNPLKEIQ